MNHSGHIRDVLSHKGGPVWSVSPDETVFKAIQLMADKNIGALLVVKDDKLVGIFTERDYTRKVALMGRSSKDTAVKDVLSGNVVRVTPDLPGRRAGGHGADSGDMYHHRRLPVDTLQHFPLRFQEAECNRLYRRFSGLHPNSIPPFYAGPLRFRHLCSFCRTSSR